MLDLIIRNITKRKLRAGLTVFGISLGIFAVMVMGGMAEYFRLHAERSFDLMTDKIQVWPESGFIGGTLNESKESEIRRVPGVLDSYGLLMMPLEMESIGLFGDFVMGIEPEKQALTFKNTELVGGRFLLPGDGYRAVTGNNVAREFNLSIGDELEVTSKRFRRTGSITHIRSFTVVGIMEFTGTDFDYMVVVPLDTAQKFYDMEDALSYILVVPDTDANAEDIARRIELGVENTKPYSPEELRKQVEQSLMVFNLITLSAAILAAVIGGLSVMNTMLMSVSERTKEFGLMKAMGADMKDILFITIGESGFMGMLGGIAGILSGGIFIYFLNEYLISRGMVLFAVTPRLVAAALLFAVFLGTMSGLFPAYRAARMSPMEALRYE